MPLAVKKYIEFLSILLYNFVGSSIIVFTKEKSLFLFLMCVKLFMFFIRESLFKLFTNERLLMLFKFTCTVCKI